MKLADKIRAIHGVYTLIQELRPILDEFAELLPPKEPVQLKRKGGRPKGSKNKPKFGDLANRSQEKVAAIG